MVDSFRRIRSIHYNAVLVFSLPIMCCWLGLYWPVRTSAAHGRAHGRAHAHEQEAWSGSVFGLPWSRTLSVRQQASKHDDCLVLVVGSCGLALFAKPKPGDPVSILPQDVPGPLNGGGVGGGGRSGAAVDVLVARSSMRVVLRQPAQLTFLACDYGFQDLLRHALALDGSEVKLVLTASSFLRILGCNGC